MKKLFSMALALVMALSLTVPAFAADTATTDTTSVTINSTVEDYAANYEAYQLLGLTSALKCEQDHDHDTETCYIYSYKANDKYAEILKAELGITEAAKGKTMNQTIMDAIAAKNTAAAIRTFAENVLDAIVAAKLGSDASLTEGTAATLTQGYWLIVDVTADPADGITRSLVMLDTAGEPALNITAKDSKTTFTKTVDDDDVFIGQEIEYTLDYTLPANLGQYLDYTYIITDTLSDGLSFKQDCKIVINGTEVTSVQASFAGQTMTINLGDHILENKDAYAGKAIQITYHAIVDDDAVIAGEGNPNDAKLVYTNDPSKGATGELKDDEVVSTYAIALKKIDEAGAPLANAEFQFPFYVKATADTDGAYIYAGTEAGDGLVNTLTTPDSGVIIVKGVASGDYVITETKAPDGYNLLAAPVTITATKTSETETSITKILDENGNVIDEATQTSIEVTYENDDIATAVIFVMNKAGFELPSTGGMGTTLFTVVGAGLMMAAAVLLVTKKKMANEE